jgi:hypothetical protein
MIRVPDRNLSDVRTARYLNAAACRFVYAWLRDDINCRCVRFLIGRFL